MVCSLECRLEDSYGPNRLQGSETVPAPQGRVRPAWTGTWGVQPVLGPTWAALYMVSTAQCGLSPHSAFQMPLLRGTAVTDRHRDGVLGARRVGPFQALPKGHLVQPVVLPESPLLRPACPVALHKPWRV